MRYLRQVHYNRQATQCKKNKQRRLNDATFARSERKTFFRLDPLRFAAEMIRGELNLHKTGLVTINGRVFLKNVFLSFILFFCRQAIKS